ncbi:MAG: hypothetical protein AAGA83_03570 [Cyanobacteria bacterium P01_F01_bin.116]
MKNKLPVAINLTSDFLPGYTFQFEDVRFTEYVELYYSVSPPLPMPDQNNIDTEYVWIDGEMKDNLDNNYTYGGGAHGPSDLGLITTGSLSFSPLPSGEVTQIFFLIDALRGKQPYRVNFSVNLCCKNTPDLS